MLRSMYAGISGMKVNQTKLDVTGNNIANVSTTGFKSSRVRFKDMLSQNMGEAVGPGRNQGGVNGKQVGLGVQVAGIDTVMSQGMMQPTSRNLDVAMDGTGYFIVAKGALPQSNAGGIAVSESDHTMSGGAFQVNYTRDGSFTLDHQGNLLTSDGYRVMGYAINEMDEKGAPRGEISIDYSKNGATNFVNADGKYGLKASNTIVPLRIPDSVHVKATKIADDADSKVDMDFTGTGATDKITTKPKVSTDGARFEGESNLDLKIKFIVDDPTAGTYKPVLLVNGEQLLDDKGVPVKDIPGDIKQETLENHIKGKNGWEKEKDPVKAKLEQQAKEQARKMIGNTTVKIEAPVVEDTEDKTKFSWSFTLQSECDKKLRSFAIEKDGLVKGVLDDGTVTALGQIATAAFKNQEGLKKEGKNLFSNTANSGVPTVRSGLGAPKNLDNGDGYGEMLQGMLEMSNVDLAEQFTDMIVTTRAFQASGKMISTGDEILQDIINLKR
ncbi:flagellar hook protein FlgE [Clostridium massiliodielmoense]|uniref:flagellar hook protein FlgE n=1 Tax=Clostridium massiliodielmoense TaxID=1776385 RepID=UPI0004D7E2D9|nr:flagellar hook-basal body complex protein [Clostridium massiliodielmoense]KEH96947.1 flagellar basal-body rod protein FlgG [Clostridium botulinum C/D str. BKT12695]